MHHSILTLDLGATNWRGIIRRWEPGGEIRPDIDLGRKLRVETVRNRYGLIEEKVDDALRELLAGLPPDIKGRVKAVAVVSHGASQILLDRGGEPVFGTYSYDSPAFADTHGEFLDRFGGADNLFLETGSPEFPRGINALQQIFWLRVNHPDNFNRAAACLPLSAYIAFRLTGARFTDRTHTRNHAYIERIVDGGFEYSSVVKALGIEALFPDAKSSFEPYGLVSDRAANEYGIPAGDWKESRPVGGDWKESRPVGGDWKESRLVGGALVVAAGHDTSVIAALAPNLASTGTWICNVARGRPVRLETYMQTRGLLVNADVHGRNLRTTIARLGQMRERYVATCRKIAGRPLPDDLPFREVNLKPDQLLRPAFTDGTGPYPSLEDDRVRIPEALRRDPEQFFHQLAFSLAAQEVLSSIFAGDPSVPMEHETLLTLIRKQYRAPDLVVGGPFAGNFVETDGRDSGRLNLFMEYLRRLYPGRISRLTFDEPTSFAAHWMAVAALEKVRPEEIADRVNIPMEDVSYAGDRSAVVRHLERWERAVTEV